MFIVINIHKCLILLTIYNLYVFYNVKHNFDSRMKELERSRKSLLNTKKINCSIPEPTTIYEKKRRRIRSSLQLMWNSIRHQIRQIKGKPNLSNELSNISEEFYQCKISLMSDWKQMSLNDGYEQWRQIEYKNLNEIIQNRFQKVMNPKDCSNAKVLLIPQWFICGWGCSTFQYVQSFAIAFGSQRFLSFVRLPPISKRYGADMFTKYYEPYSQTCDRTMYQDEYQKWIRSKDSRVLALPGNFWKSKFFRTFTYPAVPIDLLPRLEKLLESPGIWFVSQIEEFLLKLKLGYIKSMKKVAEKIGFKHPIVGVHVRRTDIKQEAKFQPIEDYMEQVTEFYDTLELTQKLDKRRIFLATDEPSVIKNAVLKYSKDFEIIYIRNHSRQAQSKRTKFRNPMGIMTDIHLLAKCDFFVGTFTSNVGRRVFEFMLRTNLDTFERVNSIDSNYFEYIGVPIKYKVLVKHSSGEISELQAQVGDIISVISKNVVPGWIHGNIGQQKGIIPAYKVEEISHAVDFP